MSRPDVSDELILSVVVHVANHAAVGLLLRMSACVIVSIADRCKPLRAMSTLVWFLASVNSHVNEKVASLIKLLAAVLAPILGNITRNL